MKIQTHLKHLDCWEWLGLRRKDESEMVGTQGGGMPKA